jgi:cyclase
MLKTRIITTVLIEGSQLVKGQEFDNWRKIDTVLPIIKLYNLREVDEILICDIGASKGTYEINYEFIKNIVRNSFIPVSYAGGVYSINQMKSLLEIGVEKIVLNSVLYKNIDLLNQARKLFGAQAIILGIDVVWNENDYFCSYKSNTEFPKINIGDHLKTIQEYEFGELLITSVNHDGTRKGYDIDLYTKISDCMPVKTPLIVSGGAGKLEDFAQVSEMINPSAMAASSVYLFTEITPLAVKKYLRSLGINTRC